MSTPEETRVKDAISQKPHVINGLATVADALEIMRDTSHDALVIEKRSVDDEYGLITTNMIARQVTASNRNPSRVSVYEVMEKPAVQISCDMQARYAIRLLTRLGLEFALVIEEGHLIGTVNLRDLTLAEM